MNKLIGLLLLSMVFVLAACGSETPDTSNESSDAKLEVQGTTESKPEEKEEKKVEKQNLKVGDSATIDDITVTINKVTVSDQRNDFDDVNPERAIIIDFTVENNSDADYPVGMDFSFYVDGKKVETLSIGDVTVDSISPGRSLDGQVAYPADGEKLELEFQPMIHFGNERYIFDIEL